MTGALQMTVMMLALKDGVVHFTEPDVQTSHIL